MHAMRRLLGLARQHWKMLTLGVLATIASGLIDASMAYFVKPVIDQGLITQDTAFVRLLPFAVIVFFIVRGAVSFISEYAIYRAGREVVMDTRQVLFKHILHLPLSYLKKHDSAYLLSTMIYNVEQLARATTDSLLCLLKDGVMALGLIAVMFSVSWKLSLIALVATPCVAWVVGKSSQRLRAVSHKVQDFMAEVTQITEQAFKSQKIIRLFDGQAFEQAKFKTATEHNCQQEVKVVSTNALAGALVQVIASIPFAGAVYLASGAVSELSVGGFMAVTFAMVRLLQPMKRLNRINPDIQKAISASEVIFELLDTPEEADDAKAELPEQADVIQFKNMSFSYAEEPVIHDLNVSLPLGKKIAIVGRSGAGKSTLIHLLLRFDSPSQGQILWGKTDIQAVSLATYRQQFAYVSQEIRLFTGTIAENIAYAALDNYSEADIIEAAKQAHAWEFIQGLPQGLQTHVGEGGGMLSGGQRQRIALARAILRKAPCIILDEATSALDTQTESELQDLMLPGLENSTVITIAHRLSTVQQADLILVMDQGRVVEKGTHESLMQASGQYADLVRHQLAS